MARMSKSTTAKETTTKQSSKNQQIKPCVYRYIDMADSITKYVGIVYDGTLENRVKTHCKDKWCKDRLWKVEYFTCNTRAEAEAFEAHLITLYGTNKYYNKAKATWGLNQYLPDIEKWWKPTNYYRYTDIETYKVVQVIKRLIKEGEKEKALYLSSFIEIVEG